MKCINSITFEFPFYCNYRHNLLSHYCVPDPVTMRRVSLSKDVGTLALYEHCSIDTCISPSKLTSILSEYLGKRSRINIYCKPTMPSTMLNILPMLSED